MTRVKVDNKVKFKVNRNIRYTPSPSPGGRPGNCVTISAVCHVVSRGILTWWQPLCYWTAAPPPTPPVISNYIQEISRHQREARGQQLSSEVNTELQGKVWSLQKWKYCKNFLILWNTLRQWLDSKLHCSGYENLNDGQSPIRAVTESNFLYHSYSLVYWVANARRVIFCIFILVILHIEVKVASYHSRPERERERGRERDRERVCV